ncbi:MAG: ATP-binding cassette domain-containing protein [Candidatus Heimdallarchaeaceae archaeon]
MIKIENVNKTYVSTRREFVLFKKHVKKKGKKVVKSSPSASSISTTITHYTPIIKIEKKTTQALRNINLHINEGEVFGLLGPNGAGKTTLTKIISTLIIPDSGTVTVNGYDIIREEKKARASIGLVTGGERSLYWKLTPIENLVFFGRMYFLSKSEAQTRAQYLIEIMNLQDKANELVQNLSTGQKMKVAFCRGLMHDPPILLLDEYNRGLDPRASRELQDFIKKQLVKEQGKTILLCTHDMQIADELSHRVGLIFQGRIVALDAPEHLKRQLVYKTKVTFVTNQPIADELSTLQDVTVLHTKQSQNEHTTTLSLSNGLTGFDIIELLRTKGFEIQNFEVQHATLEDVFLKYTGRAIEDTIDANNN